MLQHRRFQSADELTLFCQGALQAGPLQKRYPLAGKTLTFSTPAGAVTFVAGADPEGLTVGEIQAQIAAVGALSVLKVVALRGVLYFVEQTPTNGVAFDAAAQEARRILGFAESGSLLGQVLRPLNSGRAPMLVAITATNHEHNVFWETDNSGSVAPSAGGVSVDNPATADVVLTPPSRAIFVGGAGDLTVHRTADPVGVLTTYRGLQPGSYIPVSADLISDTTTATFLVIEQL